MAAAAVAAPSPLHVVAGGVAGAGGCASAAGGVPGAAGAAVSVAAAVVVAAVAAVAVVVAAVAAAGAGAGAVSVCSGARRRFMSVVTRTAFCGGHGWGPWGAGTALQPGPAPEHRESRR